MISEVILTVSHEIGWLIYVLVRFIIPNCMIVQIGVLVGLACLIYILKFVAKQLWAIHRDPASSTAWYAVEGWKPPWQYLDLYTVTFVEM